MVRSHWNSGRKYCVVVRAEDLDETFPIVPIDSDAVQAARLIAEHSLPALLVTDTSGKPYAVLPAVEILRFILPRYVQVDLTLAGAKPEPAEMDEDDRGDWRTVILPQQKGRIAGAQR